MAGAAEGAAGREPGPGRAGDPAAPGGHDPTRRFADRVDAYVRARPGYPAEVTELLAREIGLSPAWVVADVGAGTGLSAEPFVQNGNTVVGVEPSPEMRAAASGRAGGPSPEMQAAASGRAGGLAGGRPGAFRMVEGTAEATSLPDASVDLVVAAQAFHWFDLERARTEFARILRPPGWVVVLWNTRRTAGSPFLHAYEELLREFGTDYDRVRHDRVGQELIARFFGGEGRARRAVLPRRATLPNEQRLDREGLRLRLLSTSYLPGEGEASHDEMMARAEGIFDAYRSRGSADDEGTVQILYDLEVWWGRLAPPAGLP